VCWLVGAACHPHCVCAVFVLLVQEVEATIHLGRAQRDNEQSSGGNRAEVILARSMLAGVQREVAEVRMLRL
jgi:hypothetical protein